MMSISVKIHPAAWFLIKALLLFIFWHLLDTYWPLMADLHLAVIDNIIFFSTRMLSLLGYQVLEGMAYMRDFRTVGIDGTHGLWVGDACDGLELFALFTGFMIAYPGSLKKKSWFVPLGLIAIHAANIFRVVALSIIDFHAPEYLEFNHTYTFTFLIYGFIFSLWLLWAGPMTSADEKSSNEAVS